jgi:hypothetical protein
LFQMTMDLFTKRFSFLYLRQGLYRTWLWVQQLSSVHKIAVLGTGLKITYELWNVYFIRWCGWFFFFWWMGSWLLKKWCHHVLLLLPSVSVKI